MAFTLKKRSIQDISLSSNLNPFEYQNVLYSQLIDRLVKVYTPIQFSKISQKDSLHYFINLPSKDNVIYGNIPWKRYMEGEIIKDSQKLTSYSMWLSPSVFYIPTTSKDDKRIHLELRSKKGFHIKDEQFYALDLKVLEEVSKKIKSLEIKELKIDNGIINCFVDGKEEDVLFLSVPYHKGWNVIRNGKTIKPDLFGNCMTLIPLENGKNVIEMHYSIPYFKEGCIISVLGLFLLFFLRNRNISRLSER